MARSNGTAANPRVVFGAMVRHYRITAGLTQEQVGGLVYITSDMVAKVERGERSASAKFVDACEATAELDTRGALRALWQELKEHFAGQPYPVWFGRWPDVEAIATSLRTFEPLVIPGLLQTKAYALALLRTRIGDSQDDINAHLAARIDRQDILTRERPPTLWVILDEGVLRRRIGDDAIMHDQLGRLAEAAESPSIVIQVLPFSAGAHQGLNGGGFVIADVPGSPSVAYQDTARAGQVLESPEDIGSLLFTWDMLSSEALPRGASLTLIREVRETWTQSEDGERPPTQAATPATALRSVTAPAE